MKILVIEDDPQIARIVKCFLESKQFVVDTFESARQGLKQALQVPYDGVILDLYLPEFTGDQLARSLKVHKKHLPILMLTAESLTQKKIDLLGVCDDYITKPFHIDELLARLRAVLRRGAIVYDQVLEYEDLVMDTNKGTVKRGGTEILLRTKEYVLLEYLLKNKGMVLSREEIIDHVWESCITQASRNLVDVHVRLLREKIDVYDSPSLIQTVSGRGYKMG